MSYAGINYAGPFSNTNMDPETGIRYGVISTHSLTEWLDDAIEYDYGKPHCPKCGNEALGISDDQVPDLDTAEDWEQDHCADYACLACKYAFSGDRAYSEEPLGWSIDDNGLQAINCLDSDATVVKSPYFTYAQFCSPCVPGAGNLDTPVGPDDGGAKCYCFGHDWFDGGIAPYPVYSVETGRQIIAERKDVPCANCHGAGRDTVTRLARARHTTHDFTVQQIDAGAIRVTDFDGTETFNCFRCDGKGTESTIVESEV